MCSILELSNIDYIYHTKEGETKALSNISFTLSKGEFVAIVGPSGCGKSTLLSLICGLLVPSGGSISFMGHPLQSKDILNMGYMLQKDHLLEWRTIASNVQLGLEIQHKMTPENLIEEKKNANFINIVHHVPILLQNVLLSFPAACGSGLP